MEWNTWRARSCTWLAWKGCRANSWKAKKIGWVKVICIRFLCQLFIRASCCGYWLVTSSQMMYKITLLCKEGDFHNKSNFPYLLGTFGVAKRWNLFCFRCTSSLGRHSYSQPDICKSCQRLCRIIYTPFIQKIWRNPSRKIF